MLRKETRLTLFFVHAMGLLLAVMTMAFDDLSNGFAVWPLIGTLTLLATILILFRMGLANGIKGASLLAVVKASGKTAEGSYDPAVVKKSMWVYVIAAYCVNLLYVAVYAISSASMGGDAAMYAVPTQITRLLCWLGALPFIPPASFFMDGMVQLSAPVLIVLAVYPVIFPAIYYLGYTRGPSQWEHTEEAMAKGRRRAKARSRVMKNNKPVI